MISEIRRTDGRFPFGPDGPCCIEFAPRQREILSLIAEGMGDKEIAARLGISPRTVRTHLERLYLRYGIHSRSAAVALWFVGEELNAKQN